MYTYDYYSHQNKGIDKRGYFILTEAGGGTQITLFLLRWRPMMEDSEERP